MMDERTYQENKAKLRNLSNRDLFAVALTMELTSELIGQDAQALLIGELARRLPL